MKRSRRIQRQAARDWFRLLPPSQKIIARARAAGVDTRSRAAIDAWRAAGEPDADGVVK